MLTNKEKIKEFDKMTVERIYLVSLSIIVIADMLIEYVESKMKKRCFK